MRTYYVNNPLEPEIGYTTMPLLEQDMRRCMHACTASLLTLNSLKPKTETHNAPNTMVSGGGLVSAMKPTQQNKWNMSTALISCINFECKMDFKSVW